VKVSGKAAHGLAALELIERNPTGAMLKGIDCGLI
jgi:hypothetical protein